MRILSGFCIWPYGIVKHYHVPSLLFRAPLKMINVRRTLSHKYRLAGALVPGLDSKIRKGKEEFNSNPQLFDFSSRWRAPIRAYDYKTSLKRKLERARSDLRILLAVVKEKGEDTPAAAVKPPKVFISHKTEDSAYAEALKNLINFIIMHSPRYYKSAVCLNECSFLTKDCRIDQLTGVIGKEEICISPNADVPGEARDLFDTLYLLHPEPGIIAVRLQNRFLLPFRQCGTGGIHR